MMSLAVTYAGLLCVNVALSALLWFRQRTDLHKGLFFVWASGALSFSCQAAAQRLAGEDPLATTYGFSITFFTNLAVSFLLARVVGLSVPWRPFLGFFALGCGASAVSHAAGAAFWAVALPVCVSVALPLLHTVWRALRWRRAALTTMGWALAVTCILFSLHNLDFAFLRNRPEFGAAGFIIAILLSFAMAATAPAVALERAAEEKARVEEFDRLKSRFFANMSHELRTPLTLMLPPLEDLLGNPRYALSPEARGLLETMADNGKRLLKLINQLLDLSKLDAGKLELHRDRSNLARLLGEVADRFQPFAERKGLTISTEIPDGAPDSVFDLDRMELVIQNLLSNAVKFTPPGGRVTVRFAEEAGGQAFEVEDTGMGVRPEDRERIFDRFSQGDGSIAPRFGGTGIGLSLAKELVELHGGVIELGSGPAKGARFRVWIPRSPEKGGRTVNRPAAEVVPDWDVERRTVSPALPDDPDRPTVLVIDDNGDLRSLLKTTLEPSFRVALAKDGEEGVALARRTLPDVVVSDVMMPGKSGNDVARELKADPVTAPIPLILLTAKLDALSLAEGLAAGADDYVRKPYSPVELVSRIRGQLRMRDLTQRLVERSGQSLLGDLAAAIAHEINNPMAVMAMDVGRIAKTWGSGEAKPEEVAKWAERTRGYIERISRIVRGVGAIAEKDQRIGQVSVRQALEDVSWVMGPRAQVGGVELTMDPVPEELVIRGNGREFRQALLNLALNAVEAAASTKGDRRVRLAARREGTWAHVEVTDTGPGVPEDLKEKIFHPFFTTKTAGAGIGLGLSIVKRIAETGGGLVRLDGAPGRTRFSLTLPAG